MNTTIDIRASVFPNRRVDVSFEERLEVSLDCLHCGRIDRTVVFSAPGQSGTCTPTGHEFPGHVGSAHVNNRQSLFHRQTECLFQLFYEFATVNDIKYPHRVSNAVPTWARVHFSVTCPKCHDVSERSIQNNTVRPWSCVCKCGYELYRETAPYPTFSAAQNTIHRRLES